MTQPDPAVTPFDEFLDRYFRGEDVDAAGFLASRPELTEDEQRQVRSLAAVADREAWSEGSSAAPPVERLGEFRLLHRLGAGATGVVYLAEQQDLGRRVALKILGPDLVGTGQRLERFLREIRAVARLHHENIVAIHAAGTEAGLRYMAMELVAGRGLDEILAEASERGERPALADVLRWGREVARALHAAHDAGIVHRDVKPSNIRIADDGRAMLLDFGLALEAGASTLTQSGAFCGSPQYASPEQVGLDGKGIGAATDVYSLGATLYEALTGTAPFRGETREQLFRQILSREPVPPRRLNPRIPRDLETVVLAALEKDPARRHPDAASLAADLEAVEAGRPVSVRPVTAAGRLWRWARREPAKATLLALLFVTLPTIAALVTAYVKERPAVAAAQLAWLREEEDHLLAEASLELSEGRSRAALRLFEEVLGKAGSSPEAVAGKVLAQLACGEPESAFGTLEEHGHLLPPGAAATLLRGDVLRALGRHQEADALVQTVPEPQDALDHHLLGERELLAGEREREAGRDGREPFARALRHATRAVLLSPSPRLVLMALRAHAAGHLGDRDVALDTAAVLAARWPRALAANFWAGFALARTDDPALLDGAIAAYREAIRLRPEFYSAHYNLGLALKTKGREEAAVAAFREAIRLWPESVEAHTVLGNTLAATGHAEQAIAAYREAIRLRPEYASAHYNLGVALKAKGRADDATAAFREAIRLQPDFAEAHTALGGMHYSQGRLDDAIAAHRAAIRWQPDLAQAHCSLGVPLNVKGFHDEALAAFREAIRLQPDFALAHFSLGLALLAAGRPQQAVESLRRGHDLGARQAGWTLPSAQWLERAERMAAQDAVLQTRLAEHLAAGTEPATPAEMAVLARVALRTGQPAVASHWYATALEREPALGDDRQEHHRFHAACAAVLTASETADAVAVAWWRRASRWLDQELEAWEAALASGHVNNDEVRLVLASWRRGPDLASIRDDASNSLPEVARQDFAYLWAKVEGMLAGW